MIEILEKFQKLPKKIKDKISSPEVFKVLEEKGKKHNIDLSRMVVFLMTKTVRMEEIENFLKEYYQLGNKEVIDDIAQTFKRILNPILQELATNVLAENGEDQEIKDIKNKMEIEKPSVIDNVVFEVIKKSNLSFEDDILKKRFENIVFARLKDVRDDIETKEVLIKAIKIGGLGLDDASADRVVKIIKDEFEKMDEKIKKELNLPKFELPKVAQPYPAAPIAPIAIEAAKPNEIIPEPEVFSDKTQPNSLEKEISSILKENKLVGPDKSIKEPALVIKPEIEAKKIEPEPQPEKRKIVYESFKLAPLKSSENKAAVEDITRPPKVMGPIEELKYLSLKIFRRLAADPKEAILKIKQKIDVMEKESLVKKIQAIKAWRQSEVYKLYLEIGKESIEKNRETSQIVQERENSGKITLSEAEIEAIVELNKSLRF